MTPPKTLYVNDNLGSPAAGDTTLGAERLQPLFHLFNGDLCFANLAEDRVRTWWDFWQNNSRSARKRPPVYVHEQAPWSAVRNAAHAYGFAAFAVDPGSAPGGITTIKVTYYDVVGRGGELAPFETFTLRHLKSR